jgi:MarR-like DNA-binding transcriptional regulator SgrR of sgrS sRNA
MSDKKWFFEPGKVYFHYYDNRSYLVLDNAHRHWKRDDAESLVTLYPDGRIYRTSFYPSDFREEPWEKTKVRPW